MGDGMKPKTPATPSKPVPPAFIGPPIEAIQCLESAAVKDLGLARLTLGLLESLTHSEHRKIFPDYSPSLFDWRRFPGELQKHANGLVEWALKTDRADIGEVYRSADRIAAAVRQTRMASPLGKRYRSQADRLMRLYPAPLKPNYAESIETYDLLREFMGKPLTERVILIAKPLNPQILQIVPHDAYLNHTWAPGALTIRLNDDGYTIQNITLALEVPKQVAIEGPRTVRGALIDYFETGTEGVIWTIDDESRHGRPALETICEGDHLTILDPLGNPVWKGAIRCDKKAGWRPYPKNPDYGQQCALGRWIHWVQKGFKPDEWAEFFIRAEYDRFQGILVRGCGSKRNPKLGPEAK
jgi:hypothetical protein